MTLEQFLNISQYGIQTAMLVSAPPLFLGLAAGISVSILQAATQINDAALAFIPKIVATVIALVVFGPWMISEMASFATYALTQIPNVTQ